MISIDLERIGGLHWTERTKGRLSRAERFRLRAAIVKSLWESLIGRAGPALGWIPAGAADVDVRVFEPPDSHLAREAEEACAEQPAAIARHSYRTWMFGLALASVDRTQFDRELFYCAALLHDYGLAAPTPHRDFTLGSAERAIVCAAAAGVAAGSVEALADARHPAYRSNAMDRSDAICNGERWPT
jgi:hypothetical protein